MPTTLTFFTPYLSPSISNISNLIYNIMYNKHSPKLLNKGETCRGCVLSISQLDDVRDLIEELDLIPLGAIPPGLYPHIKEFQEQLVKDAIPFDPISNLVVKPLAERLRERKRVRVAQQQEELFELCV